MFWHFFSHVFYDTCSVPHNIAILQIFYKNSFLYSSGKGEIVPILLTFGCSVEMQDLLGIHSKLKYGYSVCCFNFTLKLYNLNTVFILYWSCDQRSNGLHSVSVHLSIRLASTLLTNGLTRSHNFMYILG